MRTRHNLSAFSLRKQPVMLAISTVFAIATVCARAGTDLGTLRADNSGSSTAFALSADGSVVVGGAHSDYNSRHAFRWTADGGMTDLGTLRADNSGSSVAYALSADGNVVAGRALNDSNSNRAFRWTAENGMTDLGTLKADNSGISDAFAMSADGSVVAGYAQTDGNNRHAFRWTAENGMTDLGTLMPDNSGTSVALALSADGSVVAGQADNDNTRYPHAFLWTAGGGMTDLGTLMDDNSGFSSANALSANGSVVAGEADTGNGIVQAFRWTAESGMTSLGTLEADNAGGSYASALSADGSVVVGTAKTDIGFQHAFAWRTDTGMFDLTPTLLGHSSANALSADGTVVAGSSTANRATLWKITWPTPPETTSPDATPPQATSPDISPPATTPPVVTQVDVQNARQDRFQLAGDTLQVLEMQRQGLKRLRATCDVSGQGRLCLRAGTDYLAMNHADDQAAFLSLGYGLTPTLSAGFSVATSLASRLPDSFSHTGGNTGAGLWTGWHQADTDGAWFATLSAAASRMRTDISTGDHDNADLGKGSPDIRGWSASLEAGREMTLSPALNLKLAGGLSHDNLTREGYTDRESAFPFTYDAVRYRLSYAFVSAEAAVALTPRLHWISTVWGEQDLNNSAPMFQARAKYLGDVNTKANLTHTRGGVSSGVAYAITPVANVALIPWAGNSALGDMSYGGRLSLTGQF